MKIILKRFGAYLIDIIIVSIIAAVLSNIGALNSQLDSYIDVYEDYIKIQDDYKDKKITNEQLEKKMENLNYDLSRCSVSASIISLACIVAYFGIFQYSQNGKTVGKRIFKLQVVKKDGGDLNILRFLLRSVILNNIIFTVANVICISVLSKNHYMSVTNYISNAELIVQILILITIAMSSDNRGLHDYIAGSKVIDLKQDAAKEKDEKRAKKKEVIEGEIIEKIKEPKKSS